MVRRHYDAKNRSSKTQSKWRVFTVQNRACKPYRKQIISDVISSHVTGFDFSLNFSRLHTIPILPEFWNVPVGQMADYGTDGSQNLKLIKREIIFKVLQPMWSHYFIVTDRGRDGQITTASPSIARLRPMSILCVGVTVAKCIGRPAANGLEDQVRVGPPPGIKNGESHPTFIIRWPTVWLAAVHRDTESAFHLCRSI